jgi:ABC-type phosphate transport system substrate-binding protein
VKIKKIIAMSTVAGVALAGLAFASSASAEPVSNSYVLVGSDTLQDSTNALINGSSKSGAAVRVTYNSSTLGSFDAFGTAAIQTKPNGPFFGRPAGSGAGVTALRASITGAGYAAASNATPSTSILGQIDIARSSSGPGANANANGLLYYVPFARDAVGYVYKGGTAAWANLTPTQLKQIFDGTLTTVDGVAISPRLPQVGSGTRNFFLGALGYTGSSPVAPGVNDTGNVTPENDATAITAGQIIPFSAASWVAQGNGVTGTNSTTSAGATFGSPITGAPAFTGTAPALVPNAAFYNNGTFGRDTYLVVERARVTVGNAKYDAGLATLVNPGSAASLTNFGSLASTPGALKKKFGFLAPSTTTPLPAFAAL